MQIARIYADFHNLDDENRLCLTCAGTNDDLARQGITLQEGQILTFWMDDADDRGRPDELLIEGVVHFDEDKQRWVASVDWTALRHASDDKALPGDGVGEPIATLASDARPR